MKAKPIELSESEREQLQTIIKKGSDWRERDRAQTILMLSTGQTALEVAERQGLKPEAIRERRRKWWKKGMNSLPDQPRSGAPSKLTDAHRSQLKEWVDAEPLVCRTLLSHLAAECGVTISAGTLRNELKRMGYVWKRTRYSLKKARSRALRAGPARHRRADQASGSGGNRVGLRRRSRVCAATAESFGLDEERRNPCRYRQTRTAIECDRRSAVIGPVYDGETVAKREWTVVLWFSDGVNRTRQQAVGGDFG